MTEHFNGTPEILVFKDAAISGATMERHGMRRLMDAAKAGSINLVVAEGLDRLSRNLKDIAAIHETLSYHGAKIWTAHEGEVSELHIGLKGTMNALYLKDLKEKVRRGQAARVGAGFATSSCPYGYRVVRGVVDDKGNNVNGIREIDETEAVVVRRIYREFAEGRSIPEIIVSLNRDRIPSPAGGVWKRTALAGSLKKAEGVLLNEVYVGNLVYNRTRIIRHPITGKRRYAPNPEEVWTRKHVPDLRIIDDETWQKVQAMRRRKRMESAIKLPTSKRKAPRILNSHNQHALTGWVKCGCCGGTKSLANKTRYICSTNRYAHKCSNSRGSKEPELLAATFEALRHRIRSGPDFRAQFVEAYALEIRAQQTLQDRGVELKARIDRLMDVVEQGVDQEHVTERILVLQEELDEIRDKMKAVGLLVMPDEATIRDVLLREINEIERSFDAVARQRSAFAHLLAKITLTPILGQRSGETINIELREEGWPGFWRMIDG